MKRCRWFLFALAGCTAAPIDVYPAAARAVDEGRLLRALAYLDQVPPAHPNYPQARTLAQAVERRLRRSQELLLRGLELRAQMRDEEALACFEEARAVWAAAVGVDTWIDATRSRMATASALSTGQAATAGEVQETKPLGSEGEGGSAAAPSSPAPSPAAADPAPAAVAAAPAVPAPTQGDAVPDLRAIERTVARGELQAALDQLAQRMAHAPDEPATRALAVRLLHQRALVAYGRGWLDAAVGDWNRVLALEPGHVQARDFRAAAAAELDRRAGASASAPK